MEFTWFLLGFPFEKETEGKKDYGQSALSIEKRKVKQMKIGSQDDIWRRYLICAVQDKSLSLLCCLMLKSVDHWSILESPKSPIIAAVGEADQQMLFAAQEGGWITRMSGYTAELSMVLKPC